MQDFSLFVSLSFSSAFLFFFFFYSSGVLVDPTLIIHVTQPAIRQPRKYSWGICFRCTGTGCVSIYFIYRLLFSIDSSSPVDLWIFLMVFLAICLELPRPFLYGLSVCHWIISTSFYVFFFLAGMNKEDHKAARKYVDTLLILTITRYQIFNVTFMKFFAFWFVSYWRVHFHLYCSYFLKFHFKFHYGQDDLYLFNLILLKFVKEFSNGHHYIISYLHTVAAYTRIHSYCFSFHVQRLLLILIMEIRTNNLLVECCIIVVLVQRGRIVYITRCNICHIFSGTRSNKV